MSFFSPPLAEAERGVEVWVLAVKTLQLKVWIKHWRIDPYTMLNVSSVLKAPLFTSDVALKNPNLKL